jgi:hypothetical protein
MSSRTALSVKSLGENYMVLWLCGHPLPSGVNVGANSLRSGGMKGKFSAGDRVRVSDDFFWAKGATGTISAPPDEVTAIGGKWDEGLTRLEVSALGTHTVYWVWFDQPQHDADGDGPYRGGQIWESALTLLTAGPHIFAPV